MQAGSKLCVISVERVFVQRLRRKLRRVTTIGWLCALSISKYITDLSQAVTNWNEWQSWDTRGVEMNSTNLHRY
jgi:hypothetical protein